MSNPSITATFPLEEINGKYRIIDIRDSTKAVDQNIKMVLLTNPGERLGIPEFGVGLSKYLFEYPQAIENGADYRVYRNTYRDMDFIDPLNLDSHLNLEDRTLPPLKDNILNQLALYLPYITVLDVQILFGPSVNTKLVIGMDTGQTEHGMRIKISYMINNTQLQATFDYVDPSFTPNL